jgi:proteasome lid subunit RPN8/RPN11
MTIVDISKELLQRIKTSVQAGYPYETCGLLIGEQARAGIRVQDAIQAPNLNQERPQARYELDPKALLTADRAAQDRGLEIVGIWHSHPDHPACPSETDHAAAWKEWSYMIFSVTPHGVTEIRSWRLADNKFVEEEIQS